MSDKQAQINVKLAQSTLEEWDQEKESLGFSSRAEFVRFAVNNEIEQSHEQQTEPTHDRDNTEIKALNETVGQLTEQMNQMQEQIETLQSAVRSDPETEQLADEIFSLLPDCKPGTQEWETKNHEKKQLKQRLAQSNESGEDIEEAKKQYEAWKGTPEALSEAFDSPLRKIHVALDKLIAQTHLINSEEQDDSTIYWKEV